MCKVGCEDVSRRWFRSGRPLRVRLGLEMFQLEQRNLWLSPLFFLIYKESRQKQRDWEENSRSVTQWYHLWTAEQQNSFALFWRTRDWDTELAKVIGDRRNTEISELVWYGCYLKVQCVGCRGIWQKCDKMFISFSFVSDNNHLKQRLFLPWNQRFTSTDRGSPLLWSLPCFSYSSPEWTN